MVRSSSLVVVAALVGAHLAHAACAGECPSQDSSDSYLAKGSVYSADRRAVAEDALDVFGGPVQDLMHKVVSGAESEIPSLMELEAHFEKLLTDSGNQSYNATNAETEALKVVTGYVDNILKATVKAHEENQGELDGALALVKGCNTVAKTAKDGRLTTEAGVVTSARGVHGTCRGDEGSLKDTRDDKCKTFTDKKEAFAAKRVAGTLLMCSGGTGDTSDTAITDGSDLLKDLKDKMEACRGATTTHSDKRIVCGKSQSTYEKSRCFVQEQTGEVCNTLDACYKKDNSFLTLRSQAVKSLEGIRKAEHVSATRVLCYIDILQNKTGDKTEKLTKCKAAVSVSHLSISYHIAPAKYNCVRVTSAPCDADWVKAEYTDQSWHAKANTEDCSPCLTVAPTPVPTPVVTMQPYNRFVSLGMGNCLTAHSDGNEHPPRAKAQGKTDDSCRDLCDGLSGCTGYCQSNGQRSPGECMIYGIDWTQGPAGSSQFYAPTDAESRAIVSKTNNYPYCECIAKTEAWGTPQQPPNLVALTESQFDSDVCGKGASSVTTASGHECDKAIDGDSSTPGAGWSFGGKDWAEIRYITLSFSSAKALAGLKIISCIGCTDGHPTDFALSAKANGVWNGIRGIVLAADVAGGAVTGGRVTCSGQEFLTLTFGTIEGVTDVTINVYASDASNDNIVLAEVIPLIVEQ